MLPLHHTANCYCCVWASLLLPRKVRPAGVAYPLAVHGVMHDSVVGHFGNTRKRLVGRTASWGGDLFRSGCVRSIWRKEGVADLEFSASKTDASSVLCTVNKTLQTFPNTAPSKNHPPHYSFSNEFPWPLPDRPTDRPGPSNPTNAPRSGREADRGDPSRR